MICDCKQIIYYTNLIRGIIFGWSWALVGACTGPIYLLAGVGYCSILVVIDGALLETFVYGQLRCKLSD